ncbi:hypothetical protein [Acetobacter nitrogenifigens]|nr:hypothetical protein [Acetobacter nitrogenifigens]
MIEPTSTGDAQPTGTTVFAFPNRQVLSRREAARYLGVTPLCMKLLTTMRCGPEMFSPGRFRVDALDHYRAGLFERAGFSLSEAERRRSGRKTSIEQLPPDPFVEMAARQELREAITFVAGRAAIGLGLAIIVLSHTPVWRLLRSAV